MRPQPLLGIPFELWRVIALDFDFPDICNLRCVSRSFFETFNNKGIICLFGSRVGQTFSSFIDLCEYYKLQNIMDVKYTDSRIQYQDSAVTHKGGGWNLFVCKPLPSHFAIDFSIPTVRGSLMIGLMCEHHLENIDDDLLFPPWPGKGCTGFSTTNDSVAYYQSYSIPNSHMSDGDRVVMHVDEKQKKAIFYKNDKFQSNAVWLCDHKMRVVLDFCSNPNKVVINKIVINTTFV